MAEAQVFSNPATGQEIRVIGADADSVVVESLMPPNSPKPPPHLHPFQAERFEVLDGEVEAVIGGERRSYSAGQRFEVPAGTVHEMSNASAVPARLRWETRPALKTLGFFQTLGRVWQGDREAARELMGFSDEIRLDLEPRR